ncbi:peptide MFS transporter [Millionella massiliensis]|uniref:peptide MFS transporter n=1 Tax=Millionella massiliensis TaxID=1871023 RepID=UPI0008DA6853|nr:peptide MFS transporter [Millionella massiliensis]
MLKGQPKGLFVLALANMGERFGYYTMLAIFVLYMQAKFGYTSDATSTTFGIFLSMVYFLPLFGGLLADKVLGYGKTIMLGIIVMFAGYFCLAIPTGTGTGAQIAMFGSLALIAIGTGCFKGNLQALVGNLYDDPKYSAKRDIAFSIFYMCINIGAFFAPSAAEGVSNYFLEKDGFTYNADIPSLAHQLQNGTISTEAMAKFTDLAAQQGHAGGDLATFGQNYITSLSQSYNYGFGVACLSLIVSMLIFVGFRKYYKAADKTEKQKQAEHNPNVVELTPQQVKDRMVALGLVFAVVIFFWMAFHQNGLTMTFFARDYTQTSVSGLGCFGFSLLTLIPFVVAFYGLLSLFQSKTGKGRLGGLIVLVVGAIGAWLAYTTLPQPMSITPQIFQQFNPFFIIILTPVTVGLFSWLQKRNSEPSAPRKIGIGMIIAALGFVLLAFASTGLPTPNALESMGGLDEASRVSPNWLISTYFVLTIAELFLSPMGISFVSKVAPPKYKGLAQGGWLAATAVGNYLVAIIGYLWGGMPLWMLWGVLVICCAISAIFLFSVMKKLERTTKDA